MNIMNDHYKSYSKREKGRHNMAKKVTIRGTNLEVNPIGLGANAVGGQRFFPSITDDAGRQFLMTALENDIDFWDTAFIYGPKRSEEIIGEILRETGKRQDIVLATKGAHEIIGDEIVLNNRPEFLKRSVEDSLKRLQTNYIDLYYIHFPDDDTPKYEAIGALKELQDEGKIRSIGVSNFSLEQLKEANRDGYVNVYQGNYNLLDRSAEKELFPYTLENNISFVPYFPLASGLLAGKYTEDTTFPDGDTRLKKPHFQGENFKKNLEKVEQLKEMAKKKNVEVVNLVLATYLLHEAIDVIIPGAKKSEQVISNLKTLQVNIDEGELEEIYNIFN